MACSASRMCAPCAAASSSEDAGPLAHPVQPQSYIEINNFYTATIYDKGSEVIGMLKTLVGDEGYRKATDLYFERHDGQAATVEDWVKCFEDACGRDLTQFRLWYRQAGTPVVEARGAYDAAAQTYTLELTQIAGAHAGPARQEAHAYSRAHRPGRAKAAARLPLTLEGENRDRAREPRAGTDARRISASSSSMCAEEPLLSLGRDFSAPAIFRTAASAATTAPS